MLSAFLERLRQKHRTASYPADLPKMPDRYRGLPVVEAGKCESGCGTCVERCPTDAIVKRDGKPVVDMGSCLFCGECESACPNGAIRHTSEFRTAARTREELLRSDETHRMARQLDARMRTLFGRSLRLRQVSAGGCNACEADVNVLTTVVFDLSRFGINFVASPRHSDGMLITGPVTKHMREPLLRTWEAIPAPKLVIACGACAISGGPFRDHDEQCDGADSVVPVDLYIPGCPPNPWTILDGMLRLLGQVPEPAAPA